MNSKLSLANLINSRYIPRSKGEAQDIVSYMNEGADYILVIKDVNSVSRLFFISTCLYCFFLFLYFGALILFYYKAHAHLYLMLPLYFSMLFPTSLWNNAIRWVHVAGVFCFFLLSMLLTVTSDHIQLFIIMAMALPRAFEHLKQSGFQRFNAEAIALKHVIRFLLAFLFVDDIVEAVQSPFELLFKFIIDGDDVVQFLV